jgi:hypothetical protein
MIPVIAQTDWKRIENYFSGKNKNNHTSVSS